METSGPPREPGDTAKSMRLAMVDTIRGHGVADERVLAVMTEVPRHCFVPGHDLDAAYADRALPIDAEQTISQPLVVAWMASVAHLDPTDRVLEVGAGSGYGAAVLGRLAAHVVTTERIPNLADQARKALAATGASNVEVVVADGSDGWVPGAPYDAIVVTAASPEVPGPLLEQLAEGGRLVVPVGGQRHQQLLRVERHGDLFPTEDLGPVAFVPLVGRHGWPDGTPGPSPGRGRN